MSGDTPPSIPPRKSGGDASTAEKGTGARTGTDTAARSTTSSGPAASSAPAKPAATKATPTTSAPSPAKDTPRTSASAGSPSASTTTAPAAPPKAAAPAAPAGASSSTASTATRATDTAQPAASARASETVVAAGGGPRRVRLAISRVDPWSVMKLSFLFSVAVGIMIVVATAVVWLTLDSLEVFAQIDGLITEILADSDFDIMRYVEFNRVISISVLIAVVDIFLMTALATIGAFLYNITAALVGGVHVTMTDD